MAMSASGKQNTVPASFQSYLVSMSTKQSSSTTQYDTVASHCAQRGFRPRQSVSVISSSAVPSFLPYCFSTSSQVNSDSMPQRSSFQNVQPSNVQHFRFHLFDGLANNSNSHTVFASSSL